MLLNFIFISLCFADNWEISYSGNEVSILHDSNEYYQGLPNIIGNVATIHNISWYINPLSISTLPSSLENKYPDNYFTIIDKITDDYDIFVGTIREDIPYVRYFGEIDVTNEFECDISSPFTLVNFLCISPIVDINYVFSEGKITIDLTNSDVDINEMFLIIGLSHITSSHLREDLFSEISNRKDTRLERARVFIFFFYFLISIGMVFLVQTAAAYTSWLLHWFKKYRITIWTGIFSVVIFGISWAGGFFGWAIAGIIILVYNIVLFCIFVYLMCIRHKNNWKIIMTKTMEKREKKDTEAQTTEKEKKYHIFPEPISHHQYHHLVISSIGVLFALITVLLVFYATPILGYLVFDRTTQQPVTEYQEQIVAKTALVTYAYPGLATVWHIDSYFKLQTEVCKQVFNRILVTDEDKYNNIQVPWIEKYNINMTIFEREDYRQYDSVNDWFTRYIKNEFRPLSGGNDDNVIVSMADSRVLVFPVVPADSDVWIKDDSFTVKKLLGNADWSSTFEGGSMIIFRLAVQDYHRFHSPINGTLNELTEAGNTLHSVSFDAMTSDNEVIYNHRKIAHITSNEGHGDIAIVSIGATCVGSVVIEPDIGEDIIKGDSFGYFQFGGSTVVVLFPPGVILFDEDLLAASLYEKGPVETLVRVRQQVARWR